MVRRGPVPGRQLWHFPDTLKYQTGMRSDNNTEPAPAKSRPPAVLQIVPRLVSAGADRGTVDMARALAAAGWMSYVASSGGPLERDILRSGAIHLRLPLASKN